MIHAKLRDRINNSHPDCRNSISYHVRGSLWGFGPNIEEASDQTWILFDGLPNSRTIRGWLIPCFDPELGPVSVMKSSKVKERAQVHAMTLTSHMGEFRETTARLDCLREKAYCEVAVSSQSSLPTVVLNSASGGTEHSVK